MVATSQIRKRESIGSSAVTLGFSDCLTNPLKRFEEVNLGQQAAKAFAERLDGINNRDWQVRFALHVHHLRALHKHEPRPHSRGGDKRAADPSSMQFSMEGLAVEDLLGTRNPHRCRAVKLQRPAHLVHEKVATEDTV